MKFRNSLNLERLWNEAQSKTLESGQEPIKISPPLSLFPPDVLVSLDSITNKLLQPSHLNNRDCKILDTLS